jgi:hypothetical protein
MSGPIFGLCPGSRDWVKESSGNPRTGKDWIRAPPGLPKHLDDTDDVMMNLAIRKIEAFSGIGHGFFFWNFRTDLYEPQWSYMAALERGWIPDDNLRSERISHACHMEDNGDYRCVLKKKQLESNIKGALDYIYNVQNLTDTPEFKDIMQKSGDDLQTAAEPVIEQFFDEHRHEGVTCDFGGIATLLEQNRTFTDDDKFSFDDDEYFVTIVNKGPKVSRLPRVIRLEQEFAILSLTFAFFPVQADVGAGYLGCFHCAASWLWWIRRGDATFSIVQPSRSIHGLVLAHCKVSQ